MIEGHWLKEEEKPGPQIDRMAGLVDTARARCNNGSSSESIAPSAEIRTCSTIEIDFLVQIWFIWLISMYIVIYFMYSH